MGCDIHLYVEYREPNDAWWSTIVKNPHLTRDYRLFNALAGVRGEGAPLYALRGFPRDNNFSDSHADYFEDGGRPCPDWHSTTWLTPDEFERVLTHVADATLDYHAILALCRVLEQAWQCRLVMWFDN